MGIKRSKSYHIKEISSDGLVKEPKGTWGHCEFSRYGYNSEDEAWDAVERHARSRWMDNSFKPEFSYVVICEWAVSHEDD